MKDCFSALESGGGGERKGLRKIKISKYVSEYLQVPRQKNIYLQCCLGDPESEARGEAGSQLHLLS